MALSVTFTINFQLSNSPKDLKWTDTTNYAAEGLNVNNMTILLWIVNGAGTTIYKNAGYSTNDFSSPDITRSATAIKDGIVLAVDSNDNPITGTYYFYCKVQDSSTSTVYEGSNSYSYSYVQPTLSITQSYSCMNSTLTSTDSTTYTVESITPSITRTHTITKPTGSGANDPGSTADTSRTIGGGSTPATRLWTGEWTTSISSVLSYEMETWGGSAWLIIGDSVTGSETVDVTCTNYIGDIQSSTTALWDRWKTAKTEDLTEATRLLNVIIEILTLFQEYYQAREDGDDYISIAAEIATLLSQEGFPSTTASTTTQEVVPWGDGTCSCTSATITFVTSTPTGGNSGDLAIGADGSAVEWNVWSNVGGTWTLQGSIKDTNNVLLYSDFSDSSNSATTSEEVLKTYTLPANTLNNARGFINIRAIVQTNFASTIRASLLLYIGTEELAEYRDQFPTGAINHELNARVVRESASVQKYESHSIVHGSPSSLVEFKIDSSTLDLTSGLAIQVRSNKDATGTAGDITCKDLVVTLTQ